MLPPMMKFSTNAVMKSGSLRGMPGPPKVMTVCGTSSGTSTRFAEAGWAGVQHRDQIALGRQAAEHVVEGASERCRIDIADHRDLQPVTREHALDVAAQIVGGDGRHRLQRAAALHGVGVIGESCFPPAPARDAVGARGLAAQAGENLRADALQRLGVEARGSHGQLEQAEGFVAVFFQRAHRTARGVAGRAEIDLDGAPFEPGAKGLIVEFAGAFVEQPGREIGDARLRLRVLRGTAGKGEVHRDQGNGGVLHQPGLDAARRHDALDGGGVGAGQRRDGERQGRQCCPCRDHGRTSHERFSSRGVVSLIR